MFTRDTPRMRRIGGEHKKYVENFENFKNIENFCTHRGISPPGARHMGGSWERLIRSVGQTFKALFNEQIDDEVLFTIVAEVTNVLSNRPRTRNSSDPEDSDAITPNHLLLTSK